MRVTQEQRDAIDGAAWAAAVRLRRFGYDEIAVEAHVPIKRATALVRGWQARGMVAQESERGAGGRLMFSVVSGVEARAEDALAETARAARRPTPEGNMWRAARGLKSFTPVDLAAHAATPECPVTRDAAQAYCHVLVRAGYVKAMRKAVPGKREAVYRLIRDTGPVPPRERRVRAVWDANLGQFTHVPGDVA